jgi:hypothetical protein
MYDRSSYMKLLVPILSSLLLVFTCNVSPVFAQSPAVSGIPQGGSSDFTASQSCVRFPIGNDKSTVSATPPPGCDLGSSGASDYALKLVKAITEDDSCQLANGQNGLPSFPTDKVSSFGLPQSPLTAYSSAYFRRVIQGDTCLDPLDAKASSLGLTNWSTIKNGGEYLQDRPGGFLQCVGFANAVLKGANNVALTPEYNAGDYAFHTTEYPDYQWYDNTGTNLDQLHPGDAVIFRGGKFGHIAIAVKVTPRADASGMATIIVAEGNGLGSGEQDLQQYTTDKLGNGNGGLGLVGWFHKK